MTIDSNIYHWYIVGMDTDQLKSWRKKHDRQVGGEAEVAASGGLLLRVAGKDDGSAVRSRGEGEPGWRSSGW